jgi:signal transduction histidine kinase
MPTGENQTWGDRRTNDVATFEHLLRLIIASVPAQFVCIYGYSQEWRLAEPLSCLGDIPHGPELQPLVDRIVTTHAVTPPYTFTILTTEALGGTPFTSGMLLRLMSSNDLIGAIALFSDAADAFSEGDAARLDSLLPLAGAVLENRELREYRHVSNVIQEMARAMAQNATPQDLVDIFYEDLCGPQVAACVLLFFGPERQDRPNGSFDYLEVRGSWSRAMGEGAGLGMKIYVEESDQRLQLLNQHKMIYIPDREEVESYLDPLTRGFLRAGHIQSLLYLLVSVGDRPLGVIFIGTDQPYQFTAQELRNFSAVAEFIGFNTMAKVLQQQHDHIQRARATLLDAVNDGVMMVLPNEGTPKIGGGRAYVLTVNQGFTHMFNLSQEKAVGLSLAQVMAHMQIPQDVGQRLYEEWLSVPVRDPATQHGEFNMKHPDGYPANIEWYSAPVYHEDRVIGRMYIFRDASASRTASALRANFIARVSHELRTPLTSIRGFAELMLEQLGDDLPELAREYMHIILNSARHLNDMFSEVIEITRADVGEMNLQLDMLHLPEVINSVALQFQLEAQSRGKVLLIELDENLPPVQADANRMVQVLGHLLANAILYTPPETRIHVRASHLTQSADMPPGLPPDIVLPCVLVTVMDEGAGLSVEEAERVFMPFYRGKEARAGQTPGTGLGLTVSRSIIELHRGKMWAEARKRGRKGARFLFTLPTAETG